MQKVETRPVVVYDVISSGPEQKTAMPGSAHGTEAFRLGSGVVTRVLGEGGMAIVYEIWNEKLGLKRAVKVLRPNYTVENRDRFDTEIKVTAQLDHPNIIRIHSVGEHSGLPFIEMELVDGLSLAALINQRGALPLETALSLALVVARALNYTHTHRYCVGEHESVGVLHRDMKPENILISKDGKVRLTDFGIATPVNVSLHTPDGSIVGSLQYIAPEQLKGEEIDCRADIYSFGCVLYEMLTGFKAFPDRKITDLIPKRLSNAFDSLSSYRLSVPTRLKRLVRKCMQFDPNKRPRSMAAISNELARMLAACTNEPAHKVAAAFMEQKKARPRFVRIRQRGAQIRHAALIGGSLATCAVLAVTGIVHKDRLGGLVDLSGSPAGTNTVQGSVLPLKEMSSTAQSATPVAALSFVDSLRKVHGFSDLLSIMKAEDKAGRYSTVLEVRNELTAVQRKSRLGIILTMRALDKTRKLNKQFFEANRVKDAEFLLTKADYQYRKREYRQALLTLEQAGSCGALLMNAELVQRQVLIFKARALTKSFFEQPDSEVQEKALSAWRSVKYAFRNRTSNPVFIEAERECARLEKI